MQWICDLLIGSCGPCSYCIQNDVILLSCDLVSSFPLHMLTEFHVHHNATLTALLVRPPKERDDIKKKSVLTERDVIGLAEDSKMVYFAAMADLDDDLSLSRNMMKRSDYIVFRDTVCMWLCTCTCRYPHMRVCSQLTDAHLYLLKKWVIDYLKKNK